MQYFIVGHGFGWPPPDPEPWRWCRRLDCEPGRRVHVAQLEGLRPNPEATQFVGVGRQLFLHGQQRLGLGNVRARLLVLAVVDRLAERGERLQQYLAVLAGGDVSGRQRAAVTRPLDVEVHRATGIAGPQVVHVHAVRCASRRGATRRHEGLTGDVTADDVVVRVVQLGRHEVVVAGLLDLQRR